MEGGKKDLFSFSVCLSSHRKPLRRASALNSKDVIRASHDQFAQSAALACTTLCNHLFASRYAQACESEENL